MNRFFRVTALSLLVCSSAMCYAKEKPPIHNEKYSDALNIWIAAGMGSEMQDQKVPKEDLQSFLDTTTGRSLEAVSNINALKFGGVDSGAATGLGVLTFALNSLGPDKAPMRNSFWYWMENNNLSQVEATQRSLDAITKATNEDILKIGFETEIKFIHSEKTKLSAGIVSIFGKSESDICKTKTNISTDESNCFVLVYVYPPKLVKYNENGEDKGYWFFSSADNVYFNSIKFFIKEKSNTKIDISDEFLVNQVQILKSVSEKIGKGFYIYLSPNKVSGDEGKKINYPVLLEKGSPLYFVMPK